MTNSINDERGIPLEIRAAFAERPADLPTILAYAFSQGGALLDTQPLDEDGNAKLTIPSSEEPQAVRVVLGPEVSKESLEVGELLRRGGIDKHLAVRPGSERIAALEFDIGPDLWRNWIGRLCTVKGTLIKSIISGGVTLQLPVCDAAVDIYEVDPWPQIIVKLPDLDFERLRDIVDGPWPPIHLPIPPRPPEPGIDSGSFILDPVGPRGLNPQPLPPRMLKASTIKGLTLQSDPSRTRSVALKSGSVPEGLTGQVFPVDLRMAAAASRRVFEQTVIANIDLLRPILCWLYPRYVRKTKIATVMTDQCGHFRTFIWRSFLNQDQPDLYFVARQRIWPGFWVTIHEPKPVACNTWWNYACGTEVSLVTTHPVAHACLPCPPIVAPNNWVLFMAIGNTSVWRIHGANTTTRPGSPGHDPAKHGLCDDTQPWGGTLRPRIEFDSSLRSMLGVEYYRVSYKRPAESELEWRPSMEAVNRHYAHKVGDDLILEQYPLGPVSVAASAHLYKIPPVLPPKGQWSIPPEAVVLDTQSAAIPTAAVSPGVSFDTAGEPEGPDQGGLWQIKVELFDGSGNQVDPEGLGIKWRVPESAGLTGTIGTLDAEALGLVDLVRNCMVITVRVDNNPCAASIGAPAVDGSAAADSCGVMNYTSLSSPVAMPFLALQRNRFAKYSFYVQRGAVSPEEVSTSGTAAASAATMPVSPPESVGDLLDGCIIAGFTEQLHVTHTATDGWLRQSQLDAVAVRAFVLNPRKTNGG